MSYKISDYPTQEVTEHDYKVALELLQRVAQLGTFYKGNDEEICDNLFVYLARAVIDLTEKLDKQIEKTDPGDPTTKG